METLSLADANKITMNQLLLIHSAYATLDYNPFVAVGISKEVYQLLLTERGKANPQGNMFKTSWMGINITFIDGLTSPVLFSPIIPNTPELEVYEVCLQVDNKTGDFLPIPKDVHKSLVASAGKTYKLAYVLKAATTEEIRRQLWVEDKSDVSMTCCPKCHHEQLELRIIDSGVDNHCEFGENHWFVADANCLNCHETIPGYTDLSM